MYPRIFISSRRYVSPCSILKDWLMALVIMILRKMTRHLYMRWTSTRPQASKREQKKRKQKTDTLRKFSQCRVSYTDSSPMSIRTKAPDSANPQTKYSPALFKSETKNSQSMQNHCKNGSNFFLFRSATDSFGESKFLTFSERAG